MRATVLITAAVLACAGSAQAQSWQYLSHTDTEVVGHDFDSVQGTGNIRQGWFVFVKDEDQNEDADYIVARVEFDCAGQRNRILAFARYTLSGGTQFSSSQPLTWEANFPGSSSETMHSAACNPVPPIAATFPTPRAFAIRTREIRSELD